jgi:type IV secretion system protein VirD4
MSILFDKSLDKIKYFERQIDIEKRLSCYYFRDKSFKEPIKKNKNIPIVGLGGVPLSGSGDEGDSVYVDPFDSHALIIGATGSKKSRLIAMPTVRMLCDSKESMIICDPKSEIFERTANYLAENKYKLYILNLRNPKKGDCWNPYAIAYEYYRNGDINRAYEFVNDIANNLALIDKTGKNSQFDPFWDNSFASLFLGLSILLFQMCYDLDYPSTAVNIGNLIDLRKYLFVNVEYKALQEHPLWDYIGSGNLIETALMGIKSTANETRQGILAIFDQKMRIFMTQPDLVKMLSDNTINYDDIISKKPTAVFLLLPDEKTSFHGLVSLFVKQSYEYIITKLQEQSSKNLTQRVNYILDEFSSLPKIKDFSAMITAARSRNIRFNIFIQSKHQLILRYEDDSHTILSNCNDWIFLTSRELAMLEDISKLSGDIYESSIRQPVLSVAELQRLDKDTGEALIFCGRLKPYITRLPDIEKYDEGRFVKIELKEKEFSDNYDLDFNSILQELRHKSE